MNKLGVELVKEKYGFVEFLDYLERASGGFGNGFSLVKDSKIIFTKKGVNLTNKQITRIADRYDYDWMLYHTRIASVGSVSDANCHPFRQGNIVLAMNGTETDFKGIAKILGTTDTEAVLKFITRFRLPLRKTLTQLTGTYIGFVDGKAFAVSNQDGYKNLEIVKTDDGALIFASQLPDVFEKMEAKRLPFFFEEGVEMPELVKLNKSKTKVWCGVQDGGKFEYGAYSIDDFYESRFISHKGSRKKNDKKNDVPALTPDSLGKW